MPAPKVLTAGGASSSLPLYKKNGTTHTNNNNNNNNNKYGKFSSESGSGSGLAKAENKDLEPFLPDHPAIQESHSSEGLSVNSQSSNLSYDNEEDHSEMHGLLSGDSDKEAQRELDDLYHTQENSDNAHQSLDHHDDALNSTGKVIWLTICFFGIMFSFVGYGLLLEYATSGGRKLHELSFLFVTSLLYTCTAAAGRHVRDETPSTIPPARFAVLGVTSMGSTFCSVRSLR